MQTSLERSAADARAAQLGVEELRAEAAAARTGLTGVRADVDAVRGGRVYLVDDDFAFIPGPRFILLVEKLARLIHPDKQSPP